jgi:hypothetical protein
MGLSCSLRGGSEELYLVEVSRNTNNNNNKNVLN